MLVQHQAESPSEDNLTGTGSEPALHFSKQDICIRSIPDGCLISRTPSAIFISSASLMFYNHDASILVNLEYNEVVLHAVSSIPPALYLQIENDSIAQLYPHGDEPMGDMVELFLSPEAAVSTDDTTDNKSTVDSMFSALSKCASMHPNARAPGNLEGQQNIDLDDFLDDPNHEWITADTIDQGQFDDAERERPSDQRNGDHIEERRNGADQEELDGPRKWRKTE